MHYLLLNELFDKLLIFNDCSKTYTYKRGFVVNNKGYELSNSFLSSLRNFNLQIAIQSHFFDTGPTMQLVMQNAKSIEINFSIKINDSAFGEAINLSRMETLTLQYLNNVKDKIFKWISLPTYLDFALHFPNITTIKVTEYEECLITVLAKWKSMGKMKGIKLLYKDSINLYITKKLKKLKPTVILEPYLIVEISKYTDWSQKNTEYLEHIKNATFECAILPIELSKTVNLMWLRINAQIQASQIYYINKRVLEAIKNLKRLKYFFFYLSGVCHDWHIEEYLPTALETLEYYCISPQGSKFLVPAHLKSLSVKKDLELDLSISQAFIQTVSELEDSARLCNPVPLSNPYL
ncbi:hypothetical protein DAMA08_019200 [Martiniozyma asiatica (nom. inval.)]|nr:hypothetical protein DAMA08_019200 [Martiniozyma asiatica]